MTFFLDIYLSNYTKYKNKFFLGGGVEEPQNYRTRDKLDKKNPCCEATWEPASNISNDLLFEYNKTKI